jgi:hypothetical protein
MPFIQSEEKMTRKKPFIYLPLRLTPMFLMDGNINDRALSADAGMQEPG